MYREKINIIMFGASGGGESFISHVNNNDSEYNILAVADNDEKKHNTIFNGYPVIAPEEISQFEYDKIIITSGFFMEIMEQLLDGLEIDPLKVKLAPKSMVGLNKSYRPFEDEKTLTLARSVLLYITDILEDNNITYFIDHGTLLGMVRDGDIIPWDDDIDISIQEGDIDKTILCMKESMLKMPMNEELEWTASIYYQDDNIPNSIEIAFDSDNKMGMKRFPISIKSISFQEGLAIQRVTYAPEYHFKTQQYISYGDKKLAVPYDYEEYLKFHYGEWRRPKKDNSWLDINNYKKPDVKYRKEILSQ